MVPVGNPRGILICDLLRILPTPDSREAKTVKELSSESRMALRQVYRWVKALDEENLVEVFGNNPARYRLKLAGSKLRRSVRG
jgi:DNA-binding IclR family transcriptional regulator